MYKGFLDLCSRVVSVWSLSSVNHSSVSFSTVTHSVSLLTGGPPRSGFISASGLWNTIHFGPGIKQVSISDTWNHDLSTSVLTVDGPDYWCVVSLWAIACSYRNTGSLFSLKDFCSASWICAGNLGLVMLDDWMVIVIRTTPFSPLHNYTQSQPNIQLSQMCVYHVYRHGLFCSHGYYF